jgi:hypothetical protein
MSDGMQVYDDCNLLGALSSYAHSAGARTVPQAGCDAGIAARSADSAYLGSSWV